MKLKTKKKCCNAKSLYSKFALSLSKFLFIQKKYNTILLGKIFFYRNIVLQELCTIIIKLDFKRHGLWNPLFNLIKSQLDTIKVHDQETGHLYIGA